MKKIAVSELKPGMQLSRPVKKDDGETLLESCLLLNEETIKKVSDAGVEEVHIIETADLDDNVRAMDELLEKGFKSTREKTLKTANLFLERIGVGEFSEDEDAGSRITGTIEKALEDANILVKLSGVRAVDNYLFSHSVNAAVLAMLMAMKMDFGDEELLGLAKAALMADVGMMLVPASTWEHEGPLSEEQRSTVQKHVTFSKDVLDDLPRVAGEIVNTVYQHHERCDGSGYPQALSDDDILMSAKILAVADVFAAIREPRAYRERSGPVRALKAITSSHGFSPEAMRMFLATISVYPVQSYVRLNTGAIGEVVTVKKNNPFRPVVEIIRDENEVEKKDRLKVDLEKEENLYLFIEEALDELPE
ncbi:HD domain-containing phosphohydrolase [bacterium]